MVRIYPGNLDAETNKARGVSESNLDGDSYYYASKVTRAQSDPRAKSDQQKKVMDSFGQAANIYSMKPGCWQDHFKRMWIDRSYNRGFMYYDELNVPRSYTGYQGAIQILSESLKAGDGSYYNPKCFCIIPSDIFGDPLNMYSRLRISYERPVHYRYNETKLGVEYLGKADPIYDTFRSAVLCDRNMYNTCMIDGPFLTPRDNSTYQDYREVTEVRKMIMWPDFYFIPLDDQIHKPFTLRDTDFWIYRSLNKEMSEKKAEVDLSEFNPVNPMKMVKYQITPKQVRGMELRLKWPWARTDLCCRQPFKLNVYTAPNVCYGKVQGTDTGPFFGVYLGNEHIGDFGAGCGRVKTYPFTFNSTQDEFTTPRKINWKASMEPVHDGWQPDQYPVGKLTELRLSEIMWGRQNPDVCFYNSIDQIFISPEPFHCDLDARTPTFKFNIHSLDYNTHYMSQWFPYGAAYPAVGNGDGTWWWLVLSGGPIELRPEKQEYCFTNWLVDGDFTHFRIHIRGTPGPSVGSAVKSYIGDPQCQPFRDSCKHPIPLPLQRGVFVLEYDKDFVVTDPCCRCPEHRCPKCVTTLPKCEKEKDKFKLGDECKPCEPADSHYHVYDNLI